MLAFFRSKSCGSGRVASLQFTRVYPAPVIMHMCHLFGTQAVNACTNLQPGACCLLRAKTSGTPTSWLQLS
jgi:hypothetical protein